MEQLKGEKSKASEETEDLAQGIAELRYQLTGLLEDEYKTCVYRTKTFTKNSRVGILGAQILITNAKRSHLRFTGTSAQCGSEIVKLQGVFIRYSDIVLVIKLKGVFLG